MMVGMEDQRSTLTVPVLFAALVIAVGVGTGYLLMVKRSGRAVPVGAAKPPAVAAGQFPPAGGGIVQRPDGRVFIHSGSGSVMITPKKTGGWAYAFGYRPQAAGPVDATMWSAVVQLRQDRELQQKLKLSAEQIKQLSSAGDAALIPNDEREAVIASFLKYIGAPPGAEQETARRALLERVRQAGEAQGPLARTLLEKRLAVLSDEQREELKNSVEPSAGAVTPEAPAGAPG
jgi:hypothetical protein